MMEDMPTTATRDEGIRTCRKAGAHGAPGSADSREGSEVVSTSRKSHRPRERWNR